MGFNSGFKGLMLVSYSRPRFPVSLHRLCCDVCRYRSWRLWGTFA